MPSFIRVPCATQEHCMCVPYRSTSAKSRHEAYHSIPDSHGTELEKISVSFGWLQVSIGTSPPRTLAAICDLQGPTACNPRNSTRSPSRTNETNAELPDRGRGWRWWPRGVDTRIGAAYRCMMRCTCAGRTNTEHTRCLRPSRFENRPHGTLDLIFRSSRPVGAQTEHGVVSQRGIDAPPRHKSGLRWWENSRDRNEIHLR